MSCKKPTFNICMLKQERFKSPTFNMGDLDLNGKTFVYKVKPKKSMGYKDYPTSIIENLVIINEFDLPVGKYQHEFGFTDDNGYFVLFQGELEITNVSKNKCTPCNANIVINDCNEVINMSYSESVIEINETDLSDYYNKEEVDNLINGVEVDLSNYDTKSEVNTKISTAIEDVEQWVGSQGYSTFSGNYNDLTNKPTLFSGNYNDLTNKPTIPTVGNGTITITQGGNTKGTFTTNQSGNTTIDIDTGGGGSTDLMVSITHADLLALVNSNGLTKGQQYRITDYVATVDTDTYDFARSNNHAFDIIVAADSENKLNENARAIRHEGDTYFPSHTKFEAWQLKYTIFNDSERFDWALSSGKGVIYQLIDEWNNDLSYDFKSIQFQRDSNWVYTFGGGSDASLSGMIFNNKIIYSISQYDHSIKSLPNNIVNSQLSRGNNFGLMCTSNTLGNACYRNSFGGSCELNTFGNNCSYNTFSYGCYSNTFGDECDSNTFGDECSNNTLGEYCRNNTFGNNCSNLIIEDSTPCNFKVSDGVSNVNLSQQLSNFTTPPSGNTVEVYRTVNGIAFKQEVSAGMVETFDVV